MIKLKLLAVIILLALMSGAFSGTRQDTGDGVSFVALADQLNQAIEARNFSDARETIEQLLPLMKKELKESKKILTTLQKAENPETDPALYVEAFNKKSQIYDALKEVSDGSVAALRAKSEQIKRDIGEFVALIEAA